MLSTAVETVPLGPPPAPRRVSRSVVRWGLVWFVFLLSSMVFVAQPDTAEALAIPPVPVAIGEALAGAGEDVTATACTASVICLLVGTAAAAAYLTKDSWLPVLQGAFGELLNDQSNSAHAGCKPSLTGDFDQVPDGSGSGNMIVTGNLTVELSWTDACSQVDGNGAPAGVQSGIAWQNAACTKPGAPDLTAGTGEAINGADGFFTTPSGPSAMVRHYPNSTFCPTGYTLRHIELTFNYDWYGGMGSSGLVKIGDYKVDDDSLTQTSTMTCWKASTAGTPPTGTVAVTTTGAAARNRITVPSCSLAFPGSIPKTLTVTGGKTGQTSTLGVFNFANIHTKYPDCFDAAGAFKSTCRVAVFINGVQCVNGMTGCYDPDQYVQDHPTATRDCRMVGPTTAYVIQWKSCSDLFHHYAPNAPPVTVTQVGPDGKPITDPNPSTSTNPSTTPSTGPSTGGSTFPGSGTNPVTPSTTPDGSEDPNSQNCYSAAWSWNPVDWVVVPVKCVLQWAFVPSASDMETLTGNLNTQWRSSTPGVWVNSLSALAPSGSVSGCQGPHLALHIMNVNVDSYPLDACSGNGATVATIVHLAATVVIVCGGFVACLRALGSGFGWSPGIGGKAAEL